MMPEPAHWHEFQNILDKMPIPSAKNYHVASENSKNLTKCDISSLGRVRNLIFGFRSNMFDDMKIDNLNNATVDADEDEDDDDREHCPTKIGKWLDENINGLITHYKAARAHFVIDGSNCQFEGILLAWAHCHENCSVCNLDDYYRKSITRLNTVSSKSDKQKIKRQRLAKYLSNYSPDVVSQFSPEKLKDIREYAI